MSQSDKSIPLLRYSCPPAEGRLLLSAYSGSEYWALGYDETDQYLYVRAGSWHTLNLFRDLLARLGAEREEITSVDVDTTR